jgi:hypothetical protein
MTRFKKFKERITLEKLVKLILALPKTHNGACKFCKYNDKSCMSSTEYKCKDGIKEYLEEEVD